MSFMEAQLTKKMFWYELDTDNGIWFVPFDVPNTTEEAALAAIDNEDEDTIKELLQYTEGTDLNSVRVLYAYGVRLSAPGYMDCTEWDIFTNKREAEKAYNQLVREERGEDY